MKVKVRSTLLDKLKEIARHEGCSLDAVVDDYLGWAVENERWMERYGARTARVGDLRARFSAPPRRRRGRVM